MVRLSKKVEYGLIAIRHIAVQTNGHIVTAREIAQLYKIPYEMLAKILQRLVKSGLVISHHGMHGGYELAKPPTEVRVAAIIAAIDGTDPSIAQCLAEGPDSCVVFPVCTIKSPLSRVQESIDQAFNTMTLAEIV